MSDLQATLAAMRETLARADADGHCRCYHESQERECHQHGDEHARLDGDVADALRKTLNVVEAVRELIGRLAPETPMSQDEMGGCVWCGGPGTNYAYATADPKDHEKDCPWVEARSLLDGEVES